MKTPTARMAMLGCFLAAALAIAAAATAAVEAADPAEGSSRAVCRGSGCLATTGAVAAAEGDDTGLLQRRLKEKASVAVDTRPAQVSGVAWCLEGGGFKAQATYVGLLAGLMAVGGEVLGDSDSLLAGVDKIATISGGTWFFSMLAYSSKFQTLMNDIAQSPTEASSIYYDRFFKPFLSAIASGNSNNLFTAIPGLQAVWHSLGIKPSPLQSEGWYPGWLMEIISEVIFATGWTDDWEQFVSIMLQSTADISPSMPMGSDVNPWAKGKTWLAGVSVPTIGKGAKGPGTCGSSEAGFLHCLGNFMPPAVSMWGGSNGKVTYGVQGPDLKQQPNMLPATFSIELGAGQAAEAPVPFCAPGNCEALTLNYESGSLTAVSPATANFGTYTKYAGATPISAVTSASSAFLGSLTMLPLAEASTAESIVSALADLCERVFKPTQEVSEAIQERLLAALTTDWSMWGSSAPDGNIFKTGREVRTGIKEENAPPTQEDLDGIAAQSVISIIDGGYTDNTGIAHAVANGATEVVAWIDTLSSLWALFEGYPRVDPLLEIPVFTDTCPTCFNNYQVFGENHEQVEKDFTEKAWNLTHPSDTKNPLATIYVGTLTGTTVANPWVGTGTGRVVTIHVVAVDSPTLSIGGYSYKLFADLVQELISVFTLPENADAVSAAAGWLRGSQAS